MKAAEASQLAHILDDIEAVLDAQERLPTPLQLPAIAGAGAPPGPDQAR